LYALTLQEPKLPEGVRVIVCEDCSPDPVADLIDQFKSRLNIEFFRMDTNTGTSAVRRFLISKIEQRFVLWLDDDVILHKNAVDLHLKGCSADNPGISVGTMEDIPEDKADEIVLLPLDQRITACGQQALPEGRHHFANPGAHKHSWGGCWTGNLMMLKEHGDKAGWLDEEAIGWGHDDTILTVKLVGEGFPMWYDKNIRGYHLRQDKGRSGNLGMGYYETAGKNAEIMHKYLQKYNITWEG
jgi:glycosyltransferase involved in cell wall biosynthesis